MEYIKLSRNISRILALILALILTIGAVPVEAHSDVANKKPKATCTLTLTNLCSDTVLKKGKTLKIQYSVKTSNNKKASVWFRSSNRKIATVSRKGVIRAKKKGTVKITVYARAKGGKTTRKAVKFRVGTPVARVSVKGSYYLRAGSSATIKASVTPKKATNKKLIWSSSNPDVISVDQSGRITANGNGMALITAVAADSCGGGGAPHATSAVYSHRYTDDDTCWIAHRGLHEDALENTAEAFRLAGRAGFWGCECDIWETRHSIERGVEDFDIVINHDSDFGRVFGVSKAVKDLTAEEIRADSKLDNVCFFEEYLKICTQYDMIPVIELKDYALTDEGIARVVGLVNKYGQLEHAQFISFGGDVLARAQHYIIDTYGFKPFTGYLISSDEEAKTKEALQRGFTGINIRYDLLSPTISKLCKDGGLKLGTWTYRKNEVADEALYKQVVEDDYDIYSATVDYKVY